MFSWKGKSKAVDNDEHELQPVITFKHMHSNNLGVRDPLRVVALCDSDAFYAACEQVRLGLPRDTPLVVLQWSSFIAVSYEARKYGISRFGKEVLTVQDAKEKCPDLVLVHVATYKEGEKEPGYWDKPDPKTHKVRNVVIHSGVTVLNPCIGLIRPLPPREQESTCDVQGTATQRDCR
jgi:DNA polymerase eta